MLLQESDRTSTLDKSKVNSNLLLSCLTEAGKSSVFSSLDNLNQISTPSSRYPRYYKKNQQRKPSMDCMVTLSGISSLSKPLPLLRWDVWSSSEQGTRPDSLLAGAVLSLRQICAGYQRDLHPDWEIFIKDLKGKTWRRKKWFHLKVWAAASKFVIVK